MKNEDIANHLIELKGVVSRTESEVGNIKSYIYNGMTGAIKETRESTIRTENNLNNFLDNRGATCPVKEKREISKKALFRRKEDRRLAVITLIISSVLGLSGWAAFIIGG